MLHNNLKPYSNSYNNNLPNDKGSNRNTKIQNNSYSYSTQKNKHALIASIYFPKTGNFKSDFESEKENLVDPRYVKTLLAMEYSEFNTIDISEFKVGAYKENQIRVKNSGK